MSAYYNENDPYAAQWLRNLIARGHIAPGEVDERSILELRPNDLRGFTQCHFFAGIGVWSYALRQAGWPDDRPVWTGSCPCQPFSAAGRREGHEDERHLWPAWFRLISESHPVVVFGEQVADGDGKAWLDVVGSDLEGRGYAVGAVSTLAAGFGVPHLRQRLYFVADADVSANGGLHARRSDGERAPEYAGLGGLADHERRTTERHGLALDGEARGVQGQAQQRERLRDDGEHGGAVGGVADSSDSDRRRGECRAQAGTRQDGERRRGSSGGRAADSVGDPGGEGRKGRIPGTRRGRWFACPSALNGFWADAQWLPCIDGKARPVEPGTFPLAHGAPARVGRLRAYGNAICAPQAAEFVRAYLEVIR